VNGVPESMPTHFHMPCLSQIVRGEYSVMVLGLGGLTLGSKWVNSKPRHSITTRGAKLPLFSAEYGVGAALSKVAQCSRLQFEHFQTKFAVVFFPDMRERSSYAQYSIGHHTRELSMVYAGNRSKRTVRFTATRFGCVSRQLLHWT
jgi:hypothetical protein